MRRSSVLGPVGSAVLVLALGGCELRSTPALITVYSPALKVSFPLSQGWTADAAVERGGFSMQTFTGRSVDVPGRPGIRVQVLSGPMPKGSIDDVSSRFRHELEVEREMDTSLHGRDGKLWFYRSDDGEEAARLMLVDVGGRLYGLFVRGEARTLEAYGPALARMFDEFSIEEGEYFDAYRAPGGDIVIKHPHSWKRTYAAVETGQSLFVGFRSPALAVEEDGTTVHASLEVTVNRVPTGTTVESFYAERAEILGDNYRLLKHEVMEDVHAISTLYLVQTQLADYLERTIYFVRDGKSFIYKFNARNQVYHAIEGWIDEIVKSFFDEDSDSTDA